MNWLELALLGGVVGLDSTSFPQAMWSRPLIAGTLAGLLLGNPVGGMLVGLVLEVFAFLILPFGAARYPESGTAAAAAAAAYASTTDAGVIDPHGILLASVFALGWEHVAGASVIFVRRLNERLVSAPLRAGADHRVVRRQLLALFVDFLRGVWAVLLGTIMGVLLLRLLRPFLDVDAGLSAGVLIVGAAAMLGAALPLFGGVRERWVALSLGLIAGLALVLVLQ